MTASAPTGELVQTSYTMGLVALSYAISVLGSFVALLSARHIRRNGRTDWVSALAAGAALGGIGVWSMHFTGMLALDLRMGSGYAALETVVSLVAAVAATSGALAFVAQRPDSWARVLGAGATLGMGVVVMHYLGMAGMRFPGFFVWSWDIVALSAAIAVAAATAALWLAFRTKGIALRLLAAAVMGVAVCAMHYTGMAAADFVCTAPEQTRFASPTGFGVIDSMDLALLTPLVAISLGALIGYLQMIGRNFGPRTLAA